MRCDATKLQRSSSPPTSYTILQKTSGRTSTSSRKRHATVSGKFSACLAAKDSAKEACPAVKPEPIPKVQVVNSPLTQPTDPPAPTEIVKASELKDLYAATLGYLTVCRVYPQIAIQMTGDIDEFRTVQHVFQRAKSLLDRLPKSVISESSAALAGRSLDKKPAPKSDKSNMEKSPDQAQAS
jgi:hypothetical protein